MRLAQFSNFTLDVDRRELRDAAGLIHVEPQVFDLLCYFARNANRVISKDELVEHVWEGRIVSDAAVNSRINSARRALGETGAKQVLIRTVPRRGFLFAGDVTAEREPAPGVAPPASIIASAHLKLPDRPSIVVLPFQNLSKDPKQDYFADGMVEEIITGLSRIKSLFVIARNSSFAYKGQAVGVEQVGREVGVRYVLTGSVRKSGERVRISTQLVEAETGIHFWAERYDGPIHDIFALQDEMTLKVVGAIVPNLQDAEIERVKRKRPDNLNAYDLVLRALPHVYVVMPQEVARAMPLLEQALTLEADYGGAHGLLAWCHLVLFLRAGSNESDRIAAIRHARGAVTHGRDDATTLALGGFVIGLIEHDAVAAREAFERALSLSPSSAMTLFCGSVFLAYAGEASRAIEWAQRALRVSPVDRFSFAGHQAIAIGRFVLGQYEEAASAARRAVLSNPSFSVLQALLAAALVRLGQTEEAQATGRKVIELDRSFSASDYCRAVGMTPTLGQDLTEAWGQAGLPP
jgi:TolB-like protein/tetratricopeptide (TPR) repeat protein